MLFLFEHILYASKYSKEKKGEEEKMFFHVI